MLRGVCLAVCLGIIICGSTAQAGNPGLRQTGCTNTTEVTSITGTAISTRPAVVCGASVISTSANAWCEVYDSPDNTVSHGQVRVVAEPGAATAFNVGTVHYGDKGVLTQFALGAVVTPNARCLVQWDD